MTKFNTREARKNLAAILNGKTPTLIGDGLHSRALVVPIPKYSAWDQRQYAKALIMAQGDANEAFRQLRKPLEA